MNNYTLNFISDPGHGWLEVPEQLYRDSGITASRFSYYNKRKKMVFLEEDCDAPQFLKALGAKGQTVQIKESSSNEESPIRNLSRMPGY